MVGTFYIISGFVGQSGVMSLADLNTLEGAGMEIGGHTVLHPSLPTLDPDEMKREVCEDRNWLLQRGFDAYSFAYPYTTHDATSEAAVAACGFNSGRSGGELVSGGESVPPSEGVCGADAAGGREHDVGRDDEVVGDVGPAERWRLGAAPDPRCV